MLWTLDLQRRRIEGKEPEDGEFPTRPFVDVQFFVIELWRLRGAVKTARVVQDLTTEIDKAIRKFDQAVPNLKKMRNTYAHADDYISDDPRKRDKTINAGEIRVGELSGPIYHWIGAELNLDEALRAAKELFATLRRVSKKNGYVDPHADVID